MTSGSRPTIDLVDAVVFRLEPLDVLDVHDDALRGLPTLVVVLLDPPDRLDRSLRWRSFRVSETVLVQHHFPFPGTGE